ncbi:MAG: C40 family peptidase [Candidatus Rhabdochlamydia oedothoracis]|nr:C40 family peptidase [Candidatus Rhabdochlamydia oedothoracis]
MLSIATDPIPVFNTPEFPNYFKEKGEFIPLDNQGLMRCLETILLPGMSFDPREALPKNILKIKTPNYSGKELYIHGEFLPNSSSKKQLINLPSVDKICKTLKKLIGTPYLWGGNYPEGIAKIPKIYPPNANLSSLDPKIQNIWQLKGVDCSGLLYYATGGYTPRNTADLVKYKKGLKIENLKKEGILSLLQPLDLITWKGHVIIVIDKETCIESTPEKGVNSRRLFERIEEVLKTRKPVNKNPSDKSFVIRRWHSESFYASVIRCAQQSCCIL